MRISRRLTWFAALLLTLTTVGCATYRFGNKSLYRPDIRTVYIPMIENNTYRRQLGEHLTEALVKEVELRTPYKVVHTPLADSTLRGTILQDNKSILSEDINDNPRDIELNIAIQFSWTDSAGNSLMQPFTQLVPDFNLSVSQSASFVPEAGQSVTTAKLSAVQRIARQVVGEMESTW